MTIAKVSLHCILKGNTSGFGSIIQVLPSNIWEYFKLSFIIVVLVFIIFDLFFLFYIQKLLYVMYTTFVIQKLSFLIIVEFLLSEITFYLLTYPQLKLYYPEQLPVAAFESENRPSVFRSSHQRWSIKKVSLKISQNSQENT